MILRDKKKLWLIAIPVLLIVVLKFLEKARRPPLLPGLGGYPTAIAFSPDGKTVVCATSNGLVSKWMPDIKKWRSFQSARGTNYSTQLQVSRLCFSPEGQRLYAGGSRFSSSPAYCWQVQTRKLNFTFNSMAGSTFDVSADGHYAAQVGSQVVVLVDLNGKPTPRKTDFQEKRLWLPVKFIPTTGDATSVAFSPDGKTLAVAAQKLQTPLTFWDVKTAKPITSPAWNHPSASSASFNSVTYSSAESIFIEWSPDGKRLAAISAGKITIYDMGSPAFIEVVWPTPQFPRSWNMISKAEDIASLAWSPDGKWLFSGGDEVRQWDTKDLSLKRSFKTAGPVAVSPDGKTLATASRPDMAEPPGVRLVPL